MLALILGNFTGVEARFLPGMSGLLRDIEGLTLSDLKKLISELAREVAALRAERGVNAG